MSATSIAAEARRNGGTMCPKCKTWNLQHRKKCVRCDKRLKPSATMLKQAAEAAEPLDVRRRGLSD